MKKKIVWNWVVVGLILVVGVLFWWSSVMRVGAGYFDDGSWIFWNSLFYVVFFGLITGFVITKIINKGKR